MLFLSDDRHPSREENNRQLSLASPPVSPFLSGDLKTSSERFMNRELSWLVFNRRVFEESYNSTHPLLEQIRFLSISASNLDEFFMVRLGAWRNRPHLIIKPRDELSTEEHIRLVNNYIEQLTSDQQRRWAELKYALHQEGIVILELTDVTKQEKLWLKDYFFKYIFHILTPITIDHAHPFPCLPSLGLTIILDLVVPLTDTYLHVILQIPKKLSRFVELTCQDTEEEEKNHPYRYITIENLIFLNAQYLFPQYHIIDHAIFRIIRDSEIEVEENADDFMLVFETALKKRRRGCIIRLEVDKSLSPAAERFLADKLERFTEPPTVMHGMLALRDLSTVTLLDRPNLKFAPYTPRLPHWLVEHNMNCFAAIQQKDLLLHHPYESFDATVRFFNQAAEDPSVISIRQTLYRTSPDSPIVTALIRAAESNKSVTALIELKARFNEAANISLARTLKNAGVQVVFGFTNLKTHAKLAMVVRCENEGLVTYCHIGTGNYHPQTAQIYTDLSLFTAEPAIGRDVSRIFNFMTGYTEPTDLEHISLAPFSLKQDLIRHIQQEILHARSGKPAAIWAKCNALSDPDIIDALYEASSSGVTVELIVRGICCLRPGIKNLSDNIYIKSIVGRFLEHTRIYAFGGGYGLPHPRSSIYISSADLMTRNLEYRVEILMPILNPFIHHQILEQIFIPNLMDNQQSYFILPDGSSQRVWATEGETPFNTHSYGMNYMSSLGLQITN